MRNWFTRCAMAAVLILIVLLAMVHQLRRPVMRAGKPLPPGKVMPQLANGEGTGVLLAPDGSLWVWGEMTFLRDPLQHPAIPQVPQRIGSDSDWSQVAAGIEHIVALKTDGSLWAWGWNNVGQLGQTNLDNHLDTPTRIGSETNWTRISSDIAHNLALKNDGSLWAWGLNRWAQLGDGSTNNKSVPTRIGMDRDWRTIVASGNRSFAVKRNGTLWAWGYTFGVTPAQVGPDTNWLAISADREGLAAALKTDGTLWLCKGRRFQMLASHVDPNRDDNTFTELGGDNDWTDVYTGGNALFARKKDGSWWVCGENRLGDLGLGKRIDFAPLPRRLAFGFEPWAFAAGSGTTLMLAKDGRLWTWGRRLGKGMGGVAPRLPQPVLRRFPSLFDALRSDIDHTPFLLWELPAEARRSQGTSPDGSAK